MNKNQLWMVRAGEDAFLIEDFISKSIISIGWNEMGDLSNGNNDREEIKKLLREKYPEYKESQVQSSAGMIYRFIFEFKKGDSVITYNRSERVYWIGEIESDYQYNEKEEYHHIRQVKWLNKIKRDDLSPSTKNTLGSTLTIFKISGQAQEELFSRLEGKSTETINDFVEEESIQIDDIKEDFIEKSREFIKDKVSSLDWEEMQELVAGVLRAMGYRTRISRKGADRGKDIIASPDGLGLEYPKIVVEVKHRQDSMGAPEIRSFIGGLRNGDKGLYVSSGGFSKEAKYEADRANTPLTLIDTDDLVGLIIQYYDSFDVDTKALLPLVKIYWIA